MKLNGIRDLPPDTAKRMSGGHIYILHSTTSDIFRLHGDPWQALNILDHNR
jgi:hypothetical protein